MDSSDKYSTFLAGDMKVCQSHVIIQQWRYLYPMSKFNDRYPSMTGDIEIIIVN